EHRVGQVRIDFQSGPCRGVAIERDMLSRPYGEVRAEVAAVVSGPGRGGVRGALVGPTRRLPVRAPVPRQVVAGLVVYLPVGFRVLVGPVSRFSVAPVGAGGGSV